MLDFTILDYGCTHCGKEWISHGNTADCHKIYYCIAGSALYQSSQESITLMPNILYVLPWNTPYTVRHTEDFSFHVLWFHIDSRLPLVDGFYSVFLSPDSFPASLILPLQRAITEAPGQIASLLYIFIDSLNIPIPHIHPHYEAILQCVTYIHGHLNDAITNEELAAVAGYHKRYFIQIFKKQLGITPRQYIIRAKFNNAKRYLTLGKSVKECAHLIGYENESDFSRDFRSLFSISPSQYKKQSGTP